MRYLEWEEGARLMHRRARLIALVATLVCSGITVPQAAATDLFVGNFETGNLSQWNYVQAMPGKVSVVTNPVAQGTYAGRFEVKEGDQDPDTGSQRAEVLSGEEFEESDVRYFRILSRVDSWDFDNWGILWKVQDEGGAPPLSLQITGGASTPKLWLGPGDGSDDYWEAPLPELGNWFEVVIRVEFGSEGTLKVWLNGKPQTMWNNETTLDEVDTLGEGPGSDKLGLHRSSSSKGTSVVYHDDYRVSDEFFSDPPEPTPLFKGDFETGNLSQWDYVQAIPGRVSVVGSPVSQGAYAGRFEVREGDEEPDTDDQRAEVESGLEFEESDVRYFRILSRVDSWDFGHWGIIWQMHDNSPGSPPLSLQITGGALTPKLWLGHGEGSPDYWEAPFPGLASWFEVVIRVEFGSEGSLKVWLDGAPQTMLDENGGTLYDVADTIGKAPGYDKLGIYRSQSSKGTAVVYHDDYGVGEEFFSDPP